MGSSGLGRTAAFYAGALLFALPSAFFVFYTAVKDNLHSDRMQLASGVLVKPEIQLFDQNGNVFTASVKNSEGYKNGILGRISELPADRKYTKVRLRSDKPIRLSRVVWHCWNGK